MCRDDLPEWVFAIITAVAVFVICSFVTYRVWFRDYCKELVVKEILSCVEGGCALLLQDDDGIVSTDFAAPANVGDRVEVCRNYEWRK